MWIRPTKLRYRLPELSGLTHSGTAGPDPDRGGLEVDVDGADGQGLGDPGTGVVECEGEDLVGRPRH